MEDFTKALTFEIKQDIANRYFGFRKRIETECSEYLVRLQGAGQQYLVGIELEMQRMQCLLREEDMFLSFLHFSKLPEKVVTCRVNTKNSSQWRLLFADLRGKGLTRKRRYQNLIYTIYNSLAVHISKYHETFIELEEEHEDICKEIKSFYRKNDLSGILNFLREIDSQDVSHSNPLYADRTPLSVRGLEQEMRITPPPAVSTSMQPLLPLPSLEKAKPTLDKLIKQAFPLFKDLNIERLPF
ncbi:MAG: hypothetical protein WBB19_03995 [Desulforhopalus sp.]